MIKGYKITGLDHLRGNKCNTFAVLLSGIFGFSLYRQFNRPQQPHINQIGMDNRKRERKRKGKW